MSERRGWRRLPRVGPANVPEEVRAEVDSHLELQVADLLAEGWSEAAARAEAQRRFGQRQAREREMTEISMLRERESRRAQWWDAVRQDVAYALRLMRRSPGFSAVIVLTLALGIGANAAVFSAVDVALLQPLPYGDPAGVLSVWTRNVAESGEEIEWMTMSAPEKRDYAAQARAIEAVAAYRTLMLNLASGDAPPDRALVVSGEVSLFDVLRVQPAFGRGFLPSDGAVGAPCVVVLAHGTWVDRFGGTRDALGSQMRLDGEPCEVIGVMPRAFFFPNESVALWRQLSLDENVSLATDRNSHWLRAVGRLADGVSLDEARNELGPLMAAWRRDDEHHLGHFVVLQPFRDDLVGEQRAVLVLILAAVGLVLLIICANLANLLLTRAETRRREMALRVALGAGQARLTRQLLTENIVLTAAGGALGVGVAYALVRLLPLLGASSLPRAAALSVDARVLVFTALLSMITGLLFGVLPAVQARTLRIQETLRTEGRSATAHGRSARVRRTLVVAEIAMSLAVVSAAALLVRSYDQLRRVDIGVAAEDALVADVTLPSSAYAEQARTAAFFTALREQTSALAGVSAAGLVSDLPLRSMPGMDGFRIEGRPEPQPGDPDYGGGFVMATPGYFEAAGIPLLRGRSIDARDVRGTPYVAVIDEKAAQAYWPNGDPIGQRIRYYDDDAPWLTIVGVVGAVRYETPRADARPAIYVPHAQAPRDGFYHGRSMTLVVRSGLDDESLIPVIRDIVRRLDAQAPVTSIAPLRDVIADATGGPRFASTLMSMFALASLLLGALGVYGMLSFLVRARMPEFGIRIALGATPASVRRMVLRQGMLLALVGVLSGAALSLLSASLIADMLYDVSPTDPVTVAAVGLVLGAVSLLASWLPARRATRADPATVLRGD